MSLTREQRSRVEQYVRPLYTELDGVDTFSRVEKVEARLARLAGGLECDAGLLELSALFHGVVGRLGSLASGGRWHLFVRGLGLSDGAIARLRAALTRCTESPRTLEEELLHDAVLLERTGVGAAVARLLAAGKKKMPVTRALAQLDAGPDPARFRTAAGKKLARARQAAAGEWIESLRALVAAETAAERPTP